MIDATSRSYQVFFPYYTSKMIEILLQAGASPNEASNSVEPTAKPQGLNRKYLGDRSSFQPESLWQRLLHLTIHIFIPVYFSDFDTLGPQFPDQLLGIYFLLVEFQADANAAVDFNLPRDPEMAGLWLPLDVLSLFEPCRKQEKLIKELESRGGLRLRDSNFHLMEPATNTTLTVLGPRRRHSRP